MLFALTMPFERRMLLTRPAISRSFLLRIVTDQRIGVGRYTADAAKHTAPVWVPLGARAFLHVWHRISAAHKVPQGKAFCLLCVASNTASIGRPLFNDRAVVRYVEGRPCEGRYAGNRKRDCRLLQELRAAVQQGGSSIAAAAAAASCQGSAASAAQSSAVTPVTATKWQANRAARIIATPCAKACVRLRNLTRYTMLEWWATAKVAWLCRKNPESGGLKKCTSARNSGV